MVFFTGLFMGGVYNNLCGAIAVELSNNPKLKSIIFNNNIDNKKSTATVVSIVVGYGALFAASDQLIVPYVVSRFFLFNGFLALLASAFLIPMIVSEVARKEINKDKNIELWFYINVWFRYSRNEGIKNKYFRFLFLSLHEYSCL